MSEDAFHEIQLNGKQLVFVFMAVTVIAVVIFLCGVLVGRGVRAARGYSDLETASEVTAAPAETPPPATTASPAGNAPAPSAQENLSYYERLDAEQPPPESVKEPAEEGAAPAQQAQNAAPEKISPAAAPAADSPTEPAGNGWSVQVAAVKDRPEADDMVKRLAAKGYKAYVMTSASSAAVFRVRIGKFENRREAEAVANRLQKEEQFKPWIVR